VKIHRVGGEYIQRQTHGLTTTAVLTAGAAILASLILWSRPLVLFPLLSLAALLCFTSLRRLSSWKKGAVGERHVTELLKRLPDDCELVNDVMLPGMHGNADHVVIGPWGVLVIETKHYAGKIFCSGDRWWVNGRERRSISKQANAAAAGIREFLAAKHPELKDSALRYVRAAVVFTDPLCRLEVNRARAVPVIRGSELVDLMRELAGAHRMDALSVQKVASSLREACFTDQQSGGQARR
jgi:hypothetical protein